MNQNYIKHLDGLRAVAIFGVIIYHAKIYFTSEPFLKGGFLGVDLFFVISGYLMTSIIYEQSKNNNFSFKKFILKRIRRIFPAILFICIVSLPFIYFHIMPKDLIEQIKSILSSIFFFSNFFYSYISQEYAAESSLLKPFIHTWSLSVEMQFYVILPLIIVLVIKKDLSLFKTFLILIIIFFICSLFSNIYFQDLNFYNSISRLWEFLFGGLVYLIQKKNFKINQNNSFINSLIILSFFTIIFYFIIFDTDLFFKTWLLIPFVFCSGILIFFKENNLMNKLFNLNLISYIGKISYSLYLTHFPIFAFSRITDFTKGNFEKKIYLGILIILVSIILYKFIETPFRNQKKINSKQFSIACIFGLFSILAFYITSNITDGMSYRASKIIQNSHKEKTWLMLKDENGVICYNKITRGQKNFCTFFKNSEKNIFLIGDSLAGSFSYDLKNRLSKENFTFTPITSGGCIYLPDFNIVNSKNDKIIDHCNLNYQNKIRDLLLNSPKSIIIFSGEYPIYIDRKFYNNSEGNFRRNKYHLYFKSKNENISLEDQFIKSINELLDYGHKIILQYPVPQLGWDPKREIFYQNVFSKKITLFTASVSFDSFKNYIKNTENLFDKIDHKNLHRVYPENIFCNSLLQSRCVAHNLEELYYFDDHHLSLEGSRIVNDQIIDKIKELY
jgi:peptidoglycan/LPS O-acetylase OafA/YrhL